MDRQRSSRTFQSRTRSGTVRPNRFRLITVLLPTTAASTSRLRSSRQRSPMTGPQRRITSGASFTHASPSVPPWDSVRAMRNHACCTYAIQKLANAGWRAALHLALTPLLSPLLCRVWIRCDDSRQALRACAHAACVHHETGGRYSVALLGNAMILTDTRAGLQ